MIHEGMTPRIVVYYVSERAKIAKAAFVHDSDALIFWNALSEERRRYLRMETLKGHPVVEVAHAGWNEFGGGSYSHAYALTEHRPLPPRVRDRADAERRGWEFAAIAPSTPKSP